MTHLSVSKVLILKLGNLRSIHANKRNITPATNNKTSICTLVIIYFFVVDEYNNLDFIASALFITRNYHYITQKEYL